MQYINHIATVTGAEFLSTIAELKVHVSQELNHAQILAEQISFLGGSPTTTVPAVEGSAVGVKPSPQISAWRSPNSSGTESV